MKVLSTFQDYYDKAVPLMIDDQRVFRREQTLHRIDPRFWVGPRVQHRAFTGSFFCEDPAIWRGVLGFCGGWYPVLLKGFHIRDLEGHLLARHDSPVTPLSIDEAVEADVVWEFEGNYNFRGLSQPQRVNYLRRFEQRCRADLAAFLEEAEALSKSNDLFQQLGVPSLFFLFNGHYHVLTNPCLRDFGFTKHLGAAQAFQEIAMYLSNELAPPDLSPVTTGGDELVARSKGFDEQSFRRGNPGGKDERRRQNRMRKRGAC